MLGRVRIPKGAILGAVLGLGLAFKILYLRTYVLEIPYSGFAGIDSNIYVDWAKSINRDGWLGKEVFYQAPFYPYLLSIIFRVFGESLVNVFVIQTLMGGCIVALIYLIGKRAFSERAGLIAALLCLLYAPFTFYETKVLTTVTEMLLGLLFIHQLDRAEQEGNIYCWIIGGVLLGFAIICRPQYLLAPPLIAVSYLFQRRRQLENAVLPLTAVCLIPCLVIGAVTVRNLIVGKDFVLISSSGGVTFAQGNNAMARGSMVVLPGFSGSAEKQKDEEKRIAEKKLGQVLKPSQRSAFWLGQTFEYIWKHPLIYLKLLLNKLLLVFNSRELGSNHLLSIDEALTPCLRLACLPFGFIMGWAVPGFFLLFRSERCATALCATFIIALLALLIFYVTTRYRMILAVTAVILAGGGIDHVLTGFRNKRRKILTVIVFAALWTISLPPFFPFSQQILHQGDANYWANLGFAFERTGFDDKALFAFEQAGTLYPDNPKYQHEKERLWAVLQRKSMSME
jgi:4-amino-4-deoxy-L-arabinose transferase-like glycosyltransferase